MIGHNRGQPIAVLDTYGTILPFTDNGVDAVHLLKCGVTYIYTDEQLKQVMENNERLINEHDFESPNMYNMADRTLRMPKPKSAQRKEARVEFIDPESVEVHRGEL